MSRWLNIVPLKPPRLLKIKLGSPPNFLLNFKFPSFKKPAESDHHHDNHDHEAAESSSQAAQKIPPLLLSTGNDSSSSSSSSVVLTQHISSPSSQYKAKNRLNTIKSNIKKITGKKFLKNRITIPKILRPQEIKNINANPHHPVIQVFREEQLGRNIFVLSIPIATGFTAYYNRGSLPLVGRLAVVALSVGTAAIWNGILLRKAWPKASNLSELLGVALTLIAFFGYLGYRLPKAYIWLPVMCFVACLLPLGVALCGCKENNAIEGGGEDDLVPDALCPV